jgi:hypothetical protein
MKTKFIMIGLVFIGILFFTTNIGYGLGGNLKIQGDGEGEDPPPEEKPPEEDPGDEDKDGVNDEYEDINKRDVEVWIGDNVIEVASIRRSESKKDIIDLRVGYNEYGLSIRVSYGTYVKCEEEDHPEEAGLKTQGGECDYEIEYKIHFEVFFRGLIEFVDLNGNGIIDEADDFIEDYGLFSFQPIEYSLQNISNDTNLHYILLNTTDGVFAAHIYLVEEFVYVGDVLVSPTQAKIDIEISNYEYINDSSQLALITKLWSEEDYNEKEETNDEKEGYSTDEKEVAVKSSHYSGFFSWKETALIDGVDMQVKTKELETEDENFQKLFICYPRGTHIYHDPKIGIFFIQAAANDLPVIITWSAISLVGVGAIIGVILRKRRIL